MKSDNKWDQDPPYHVVVESDGTSHIYVSCQHGKLNSKETKIISVDSDATDKIKWTKFVSDDAKKDPWGNTYYRSDIKLLDFDTYESVYPYVVCDN